MSGQTAQPNHDVVLRIPGPWQDERELRKRLPRGFQIAQQRLLMPGGRILELQMRPADGEFAGVFRCACRRQEQNRDELSALAEYKTIAALFGPAGSMGAAQLLLEAGEAVIRAGGYGVFIDNGCVAHTRSDWLELAANRDDSDAVFYAYVNLVKSNAGIMSVGMHAFGHRDARVPRESDLPALEYFLRMVCADGPSISEGAFFADEQGNSFNLRGEAVCGMFENHPTNNPYGRWKLEAAGPNQG